MYWRPRSEWNTVSPVVYGHLRTAISIASHNGVGARAVAPIAYPTAFFVQQPGTVARQIESLPGCGYRWMSPTRFTPGSLAAGTVAPGLSAWLRGLQALLRHDGAHCVRARLNASASQGGVDPSVPAG